MLRPFFDIHPPRLSFLKGKDRVRDGTTPQKGEFGIVILLHGPFVDDINGKDIFESIVPLLANGSISEVKSQKIGSKNGYRVDVSPTNGEERFIVGYQQDRTLVIIIAVSAEGEMGDFKKSA